MKLIIMSEKTGTQLASKKWNGGKLKIGDIVEQYGHNYKLTKFIELYDHYIIFNGVES